jgi:hypothetical protein
MRVVEIENNLLKINYDVQDALVLSGFLVIQEANMPYTYIGQIMSLGATPEGNFALVKLLFSFSAEGLLQDYDGSIPSLNSTVANLPAKELIDILPAETPVEFGLLQGMPLSLDKTIFEDNLVICSNKYEKTDFLIANFAKQFERLQQKTVIFDTDGEYEGVNSPGLLVFGQDFKLPLNSDTINFIYENDLGDVDAVSKALIQEIFIELQDYAKTAQFIPFDNFLSVLEHQYKATNIVALLLLKNKLLKYKGVFAQAQDEIAALQNGLFASVVSAIDISNVEPGLQREIILHVYNAMETMDCEVYSFVKVNDENSDKKLLKRFLDKVNVHTVPVCMHEYRFLPELKQTADNVIMFAPLTNQHDFADYNAFLNKLNADEFIVFGTYTQNMALIVRLEDADIEIVEEEAIEFIPSPLAGEGAVVGELVSHTNAGEGLIPEEPLTVEEPDLEPDDEVVYETPDEPAPPVEIIEDDENIIIEDESLVEEIPSVPVYPADDIDHRNAPQFETGDEVSHQKYGHGIVEKMIKYGAKTLVSINFDDVGKRLLDPAISEITKLS